MPCFFFEDCDSKKTDWCYEGKDSYKLCRVSKIAFYNKCLKKMINCADRLNEQDRKLDEIERKISYW